MTFGIQSGVSIPRTRLAPPPLCTCHHEGEVKALLHRLPMDLVGQRGEAHVLLVILQGEGTWDEERHHPTPPPPSILAVHPLGIPKWSYRVRALQDVAMPAQTPWVRRVGTSSSVTPAAPLPHVPSPRTHPAPRRSRRGPAAPRGCAGGWGWGVGGRRCAAGNPGAETGRRSWRPSRRRIHQGEPCPRRRGGGRAPAGSPGSPPSWGCRLVSNPAGSGSAQPPPSPPSGNALSGDQGGGETNGGSASPRWHHPTRHHKPPSHSSQTHAPQGWQGWEERGDAATPGNWPPPWGQPWGQPWGWQWGQLRSHAPRALTACGAGMAAGSWHSGEQGWGPSPWAPRRSSGSSGVARTPTHPMACREDGEGTPGRRERHREEMNRSGGGAGGCGGGRLGGRQMVVGVWLCPPARWQGLSVGDGTGGSHPRGQPGQGMDPRPSPTPHAKGSGQPNLSCEGATNPTATLRPCPLTHRDPDTPSPRLCLSQGRCRQQPQAGAGAGWGGGGGTAAPKAVTPWGGGTGTRDGDIGTGMRDGDVGAGTAPHPVYKRWREETSSQGHVRQRLPRDQTLLPAGTHVPPTPLRQLPGHPSPIGRETPKVGGTQGSRGAPNPAGSHLGVSAPPRVGVLKERALHGDTCPPPCRVPAPSAGRAAVPAARRDAPN